MIPQTLLDIQYPSWPSEATSTTVKHYFIDDVDPRSFWVYPPNNGIGSLEITYSVMPVDLVATTDALTVRDIYQTPLFDYVMYRAHQKDSDFAAGQAQSKVYADNFVAALVSSKLEKVG